MPTVHDVARYFLQKVDVEAGSSITPLKLQKLVYYAQAWNLAINDEPLVNARFEAWTHGPANMELWQKYRDNRYDPIKRPDDPLPDGVFTQEQKDVMDEVWDVYGKYDGKYLEQLTHSELPWKEARQGYAPGERCSVVISENTMKEFYKSQLQ